MGTEQGFTTDSEQPTRRRFFQSGMLGVSALILPALAGARELSTVPSPALATRPFELDEATVEDLQAVEGVGDARARGVREGLSRLAEASILERYA